MRATILHEVLESTGYLEKGDPAPGVFLGEFARANRRGREFVPDAVWRSSSSVTVYFKYAEKTDENIIAQWRREIWNEGFAPLLWVVSPQNIDLYNSFGRPLPERDAEKHRIQTFQMIEEDLRKLDALAGRLAMETGQFWVNNNQISFKTRVDQELLSDLACLESELTRGDRLDRNIAQALIGRCIFTQYLIDRGIIDESRLISHCGQSHFPSALRHYESAQSLFSWLKVAFNGDMFPQSVPAVPVQSEHLNLVADFLEGTNIITGQLSLFPYRFDVIPVELISSIYEQFAHSKQEIDDETFTIQPDAKKQGVHYTPLSVVSLIMDETSNGVSGHETVLDLTCGSGVFLVEALRRLVARRSSGCNATRDIIRSVLYEQIFGVDCSEAAIRVAAFSLYLAALELDPDPHPPEALTFEPLIGRSLFIGDAHDIETKPTGSPLRVAGEIKKFDIIVGNPPWTFKGKSGTAERRLRKAKGIPVLPRSEGQDFVLRALDFAHSTTRFGIVLDSLPFFGSSESGYLASRYIIQRLSPATIVNLSALSWLFPTASKPAVVLLSGCRREGADASQVTIVNVRWTPAGEKSRTFYISPSDITNVALKVWDEKPEIIKSATVGYGRDLSLLETLQSQKMTFGNWLKDNGGQLRDGLILGKPSKRSRDATSMIGLPMLESKDLDHFTVPRGLKTFDLEAAEWPRERQIYVAPIVLIKEFFRGNPRPVSAVADHDLVFTDAYFGASLPNHRQAAHILAAILNSALASWFFLMVSGEFGIWKRRLLKKDVEKLPIPNLDEVIHSSLGQNLLDIEGMLRDGNTSPEIWQRLDEGVFELYGLDEEERVVVEDGLVRASWQWEGGRTESVKPTEIKDDLCRYATTFLSAIENWLDTRNRRYMSAEILELPKSSPLRIVRFILKEEKQDQNIQIIYPQDDLMTILDNIGKRLSVKLASSIIGERELRVHGKNEVVIIKPAAKRHWMRSIALEDVDIILSESFRGTLQ